MDKRLIILGVIVMGLFFVYAYFGAGAKHEEPRREVPEKKAEEKAVKQEAPAPVQQRPLEKEGERKCEKFATLSTDLFEAKFSTHGGSLVSWKLKEKRFTEEKDGREEPIDLVTTNTKDFEENNPLRLELISGAADMPVRVDYELKSQDEKEVLFSHVHENLEIRKRFSTDVMPYQIWLTASVRNTGKEAHTIKAAVQMQGYQDPGEVEGGFLGRPPDLQTGICRAAGSTFRESADDLERAWSAPMEVSYTGVGTNYFLGALIPAGKSRSVGCKVYLTPLRVMRSELHFAQKILKAGEAVTYRVRVYMGPKHHGILSRAGNELVTSIDLGWFAPICKVLLWFLRLFQTWVKNWGLAIIMLTVLVKLVLWPLTQRSFASMNKMKEIKPLIDEVNEQYKDDQQKKSEALMALYKEHSINPLGGCLPMLLQMPIWFALYRTLASATELYKAPFALWITDLASPDPYYIMPIILGASMFIQQRMTPAMGDSAQAKMMMYFMPAFFTVIMLFLPSGLTLYIMVNTFLSIAQQKMIAVKSKPPQATTVLKQDKSAGGGKRRVRK